MYKDEVQKRNEENLQRRFEQDNVPQFIQKYFINLESKSSCVTYWATIKQLLNWSIEKKLINKDSKTKREYYIARSHNGKVDILETKYNEKTNSLTFETDKFSDYAILYKDTKEKEAVTPTVTNKETVKSESKKEVKKVKTGDNANIIGLMMLLVSSMFVMVFVRKKEN